MRSIKSFCNFVPFILKPALRFSLLLPPVFDHLQQLFVRARNYVLRDLCELLLLLLLLG